MQNVRFWCLGALSQTLGTYAPSPARPARPYCTQILNKSVPSDLTANAREVFLYEDSIDELLTELQEAGLPFKVRKVKGRDDLPAQPEEMTLMNTVGHRIKRCKGAGLASKA